VIRRHGNPDTLTITQEPAPVPQPGQVRIRIRATALNHLDTWVRRGVPGHHFPLPLIPGSDIAGIVDASDDPGLPVGTEVVAAPFVSCGHCEACRAGNDVACPAYAILGEHVNGGCAEFVCVPSTHVLRKPANLTFPEAASILLAPLTAFHMLHTRARVARGETVLVTAAAGGVGSAAVQLAALAGARVIALVGSETKRAAVSALGASEVVVLPRDGDPSSVLKDALGKPAFDIVIDSVGDRTFEAGLRHLKRFGRLVTCGATAGAAPTIDLRRLFFLSLSVLGSTMGSLPELAAVLALAASGDLKPVVHAVLPLAELPTAHRLLEAREVIGKVVVQP
jgi:NADPH:quinone reductase-like Zn-dependent oxidoreductase